MAELDAHKVPAGLHSLLHVAGEWGIGDTFMRETKVEQATEQELQALVASIDAVTDDALYGWLAGPESYSPTPSIEYIAFTCFTIAIDSARSRLRRIGGR